jgi:DNA-binding winged helix-turn-helix (wHTH) protein/tetratricopeptide (TPR) repeat protein/TolB-like protein
MQPTVSSSSAQIFKFGLFEADVARNTLTRNGVRVKIQDQPFRVLILLLERSGEIVTREELRQKLWPEGTYVDFEGSLNVILKKLRAAIDDDSDNPRFIETVPRRGYRFIAPVSANGVKVEPIAPSNAVQSPRAKADIAVLLPSAPRKRPLLTYMFSALALLIVIGVAWFAWHRKQSIANSPNIYSQPTARVAIRKSIAVLGFHNVSRKANDAWLATALSEMLSTELAGGEKLRLVSGEDVVHLRLTSPWSQTDTLNHETTARIGTALNSDLLVLGSYTIIGKSDRGQVRLDVRLQDAQTGEILAEIAEIGGTQDVFRMVSRIGGRLRDHLGLPRLEAPDEASVLASLPSNPEAARFYSLGLIKLREYDVLSARGLFEEAIKADPTFPLGYSMLSRADIFLGHDDQAKAEAKRGLDLAGALSRVQRMEIEASYYHANADRAKAAEIYRVLFNLFPDSLDYGLQLAKLQLESYHPDEALGTIRQLRLLPSPARDDPGVDLREAAILYPRDPTATDRLFHSAAAKAEAQGKKLVYARAEQSLCYTNRQHLQAPPECREAYEIYVTAGNRIEAGACLQLMAEANRLTGHDVEAIPLYEQALRMSKEAGSREMIGVTLNNLSLVLENEGHWSRAEQTYREAKQNFESVNDWANTSAALSNIADIETLRGHLREAAVLYRQSWELADSSGRARREPAHIQYASLLLMQGESKRARLEIEPQVASLRAYGGDPWQLASALIVLGDCQKAEGDLDGARKQYQEAIEILKKANSPVASGQVSLAELSLAGGHPEAAEPLLREAIGAFEKDKNAGNELGGYTSLSRALLAQGKLAEAGHAITHASKLADLREFPVLNLPLQLLQARVTGAAAKPGILGRHDLAAASEQIRVVIQKSQQLGLYNTNCEARLALGEVEMKLSPGSGRAQLKALATETRSRGLELLARQADRAIAGMAVAANEPAR